MEFEWDEARRQSNLKKHGFDFSDAERMDWDNAALLELQCVDGEERELWLAPLRNQLGALILVERGERHRIVMMREAEDYERDEWRNLLSQR